MESKTLEQQEIFRIIDRDTGNHKGAYQRSYWEQFDFKSPQEARSSNCHGVYEDINNYKISKYKVTYELIQDDV